MSDASLKKVLKTINDEFDLSIQRLGDSEWPKIERIPSGSLALDQALGGGWPRSRVVEIFGMESSGKTLLSLHTIAQAQKLGGRCAFFDVEYAFDPVHASNHGVDVDELLLARPEYGEQALEAVIKLCESNEFDVIVVDSVPSLIPKAMVESGLEDQHYALLAKLMSSTMQKITPVVGNSKTLLIFINQLRKSMNPYGNPFVKPGGMALDFYSSIIVQAKKESKSERLDPDTKYVIGHDIGVKVTKNKTASPFREAIVPINYKTGILLDRDFIEAAKSKRLLVFSGGRVAYTGSNEKIKAFTFASWEDAVKWTTDPSQAEIVAALRQEIVA